uniref:AT-hook motif nuclear-localized protein n=1 Tax=Davidia involucrata TaxID=16924 RepID=A0A5B7ALK8_DAVIN
MMSGSGRESYGVGDSTQMSNTENQTSQPTSGGSVGVGMMPNMHLAFMPPNSSPSPTPTYQAGGGGGGDGSAVTATPNTSTGEQTKRKRGRPRKYAPDGAMALGLTSPPPLPYQAAGGFSSPPTHQVGKAVSPSSGKKSRGRPPGSGQKQQVAALGSAGIGFTPHIITVKAGEDISSKILSFSQNGTRAVCILSANGAISNVTLRQAATSGGTVTYEGRFEILSLSGSFLLPEIGGQRSRTGGWLNVTLAGPDGHVLGGGVAGLLIAASPVQVVIGSFRAEGRKESKKIGNQVNPLTSLPKLVPDQLLEAHHHMEP